MRLAKRFGILISMLLFAMGVAYSQTTSFSVVTGDASAVTSSSAELHGTVNPGGASAAAWFEWGTTTSLGTRTDVHMLAAGSTAVSVTQALSNLQPHTTYYFRAVGYRGGSISNGDVKSFTTSDAPVTTTLTVTTNSATAITSGAATLNGSIMAAGGPFGAWFEYGTTTSLGTRTDIRTFGDTTTTVTLDQTLNSLRPNTTYYFRAVGYRGGGNVFGDILSFTTASETPGALSITSSEATAITSTSAVLKATVNTSNPAMGFFEWGTTSAVTNRSDLQTLASGAGVTFSQELRNLSPHTTYYFRAVVVTGGTSTVVRAEIKTFTTTSDTPAALAITTLEASTVSSASAELRGIINPGGLAATGWFEWVATSTATSLMNQTTPHSFSGSQPSNYSYSLSNLQPNTTYYFRAVGQNSAGIVRGDVKTFTTTRVPSTTPETIPEVETGDVRSGYVIITPDPSSEAPTTTFTYGTISQGSVQSQAGIIPTMMTTDASMFVEVIPSISRNIGVAIANPSGSINAVTLTLRDENGFVLGSPTNVSVPAHQQVAKFVNELFGAVVSNGFRGSLRMQSAAPFAAVGLRFAGSVFSALPVAVIAGIPGVPSTTLIVGATPNSPAAGIAGGTAALIIPQFAIAGGWATQIALTNNTNSTLVGRIDVFDTSGKPMPVKLNGETRSTFTYSIPVGGTFVLAPRDSNGQSPL